MAAHPQEGRGVARSRQVEAILPYCKGELRLDIGCGLSKVHPLAVGVDRNPFFRPDRVCNAARLPDPDNSVDSITVVHAVEYFWNTEAALAEWLRVLKPGGYLAMILYDRRFLPPLKIGHPEFDKGFRHTFAPDEFMALLNRLQGVRVVQFDTLRDGHSFDAVCRKYGEDG